MKVWVVAESRFEWYEIKHICKTREKAVELWEKLREELIKGNREMVCHDLREGIDYSDWENDVIVLQNLIPGQIPESRCDYPDLKGWVLEE